MPTHSKPTFGDLDGFGDSVVRLSARPKGVAYIQLRDNAIVAELDRNQEAIYSEFGGRDPLDDGLFIYPSHSDPAATTISLKIRFSSQCDISAGLTAEDPVAGEALFNKVSDMSEKRGEYKYHGPTLTFSRDRAEKVLETIGVSKPDIKVITKQMDDMLRRGHGRSA
ncbi:MAG: hypothetical protein ACK502_05530 [Alphaproteobacteria bacterium]